MPAVGLVYDLLGTYPPRPGLPPDADVEYEPESTLLALEAALRRLGHTPVRLGNPHELLERIGKAEVPALAAALSIAEGRDTRNREAWAPVLLEMIGVAALGSDALTLSLTLDKAWTRAVVAEAGVRVAPGTVMASAAEAKSVDLPAPFPLFVKPRWEGTAKGIAASSKVADRAALVAEVARVVGTYAQPALVEAFVPGPEYTLTLVGHDPPRALPVLQRALETTTGIGVHALGGDWSHHTPGVLEPELEAELVDAARRAFDALACRDFARADFRLDAAGRPVFLEINPLPTFDPEASFGILAELEGRPVEDLLAEVLGEALRRVGVGRGVPK